MKISIRIVLLLLACSLFTQVNAQRRKYTEAFDKGMFVADIHTSAGLYKSKSFLTSRVPVFAGVEYGVRSDVGIGVFGGWNQREFKDAGAASYDINYYYYGLKLTMHLTRWINKSTMFRLNEHNIDTYISALGARQVASQVTISSAGIENTGSVTVLGGVVGVKMYTRFNIGLMLEAGAGAYGLVNVGICGKF